MRTTKCVFKLCRCWNTHCCTISSARADASSPPRCFEHAYLHEKDVREFVVLLMALGIARDLFSAILVHSKNKNHFHLTELHIGETATDSHIAYPFPYNVSGSEMFCVVVYGGDRPYKSSWLYTKRNAGKSGPCHPLFSLYDKELDDKYYQKIIKFKDMLDALRNILGNEEYVKFIKGT